jgi:hypothetical protein
MISNSETHNITLFIFYLAMATLPVLSIIAAYVSIKDYRKKKKAKAEIMDSEK